MLTIDTEQYEPQLARKLERLTTLFSTLPGTLPQLEVFRSEKIHCGCWVREGGGSGFEGGNARCEVV